MYLTYADMWQKHVQMMYNLIILPYGLNTAGEAL